MGILCTAAAGGYNNILVYLQYSNGFHGISTAMIKVAYYLFTLLSGYQTLYVKEVP
jgi:hypothetical protein